MRNQGQEPLKNSTVGNVISFWCAGTGCAGTPSVGDCLKLHRVVLAFAAALAACSVTTPPVSHGPSQPIVKRQAAPDWFHHELALARHAKATHLPPGDPLGAQRAYYAIMLPACQRVARTGPEKYRARCLALSRHAAADAAAANDDFSCESDHDDSQDSQAAKTACSD